MTISKLWAWHCGFVVSLGPHKSWETLGLGCSICTTMCLPLLVLRESVAHNAISPSVLGQSSMVCHLCPRSLNSLEIPERAWASFWPGCHPLVLEMACSSQRQATAVTTGGLYQKCLFLPSLFLFNVINSTSGGSKACRLLTGFLLATHHCQHQKSWLAQQI